MRGSLVDYGIFIIAAFFIWYVLGQQSKLNYAEGTIQLQNEAILKQQEYLEAQKRYIRALEQEPNVGPYHHRPQLLYDGRGV
jgi:hypothetical protein